MDTGLIANAARLPVEAVSRRSGPTSSYPAFHRAKRPSKRGRLKGAILKGRHSVRRVFNLSSLRAAHLEGRKLVTRMQSTNGTTNVGGDRSSSPDRLLPPIEPPAPGLLAVDVERNRDGAVLLLAGEFDLATRDLAERGLQTALASSESGRVVIDLRALTFICSTGIEFLVLACKNLGPKVTVIESEAPAVKRVLDIADFEASYLASPAFSG